ncbi:MAG: SRPBCC domain-containing protein [Acidimicrobiia bacterium]
MARSIILAIEIEATGAKIYQALTTQEGLASFWTPDVTAEAEVGAALRFGFAEAPVDLQMTVTDLQPDRLVAWSCEGPWPNWAGTEVRWGIASSDSGASTVVFHHEGWPEDQSDAEFGSVAMVWAKVLLALEEHVRTGAAVPAMS